MTLRTTSGGEKVFECDDCGEEIFSGTLEFQAFLADAKQQGWTIELDKKESTPDKRVYNHFCPVCSDERL